MNSKEAVEIIKTLNSTFSSVKTDESNIESLFSRFLIHVEFKPMMDAVIDICQNRDHIYPSDNLVKILNDSYRARKSSYAGSVSSAKIQAPETLYSARLHWFSYHNDMASIHFLPYWKVENAVKREFLETEGKGQDQDFKTLPAYMLNPDLLHQVTKLLARQVR